MDNDEFARGRDRSYLKNATTSFISLLDNEIKRNERFLEELADENLVGELRDFENRTETFQMNKKSFENRGLTSHQQKEGGDRRAADQKAKPGQARALRRAD